MHIFQQAPVDTLAGQKLGHDRHVVHDALGIPFVGSRVVLGQVLLSHRPRAGPAADDRGEHLILQLFAGGGPRPRPRDVRRVVLIVAATHAKRHAREAAPFGPRQRRPRGAPVPGPRASPERTPPLVVRRGQRGVNDPPVGAAEPGLGAVAVFRLLLVLPLLSALPFVPATCQLVEVLLNLPQHRRVHVRVPRGESTAPVHLGGRAG